MKKIIKQFSLFLFLGIGIIQYTALALPRPSLQESPLPQAHAVVKVVSAQPAPHATKATASANNDSPLSKPSVAGVLPAVGNTISSSHSNRGAVSLMDVGGPPVTQAVLDSVRISSYHIDKAANGDKWMTLDIQYDTQFPFLADTIQVWSATSVTGPWKLEGKPNYNSGHAPLSFSQQINPNDPVKFYKLVSTLKYKPDGPRHLTFTVKKTMPTSPNNPMIVDINIELYGPVDFIGIYWREPNDPGWSLRSVIANAKPLERITINDYNSIGDVFKVEPLPQVSTNYTSANASRSYVKPGDPRLYSRDRLPIGTLAPEMAYTLKGELWYMDNTTPNLADVEAMAQAGVNTVRIEFPPPINSSFSNSLRILDALYQHGIRIIMNIDDYNFRVLSMYYVKEFKNHPAMLMWETSQVNLLNVIKEEDPNHAVALVMPASNVIGNGAFITNPLDPIPAIADVISIRLGNYPVMEAVSMWSKATSKPIYIGDFLPPQKWDHLFFDLSSNQLHGRVIGGVYNWTVMGTTEQDYIDLQQRYLYQDYSPAIQDQATLSVDAGSYAILMRVGDRFADIHWEDSKVKGLIVGVIDESTGTRMRDIVHFDNIAFDLTQAIIDFYNVQPDGSVLVFAAAEDNGFFDPKANQRLRPALDTFFKGIGSREIANLTNSGSWILVIKKGQGVLAEQHELRSSVSATVQVTVPVSPVKPLIPSVDVFYTAGLTSKNVSTLPGNSFAHIMDASHPLTSTAFVGDRMQLSGKISTRNVASGLTLDFDNYGIPGREGVDFSNVSELTVGLSGTLVQSIHVRFEDIYGSASDFNLLRIVSQAERYWVLDLSLLPASVDRSKIRAIHFFVDGASFAEGQTSGVFSLLVNGVNTGKPDAPKLDTQFLALTTAYEISLKGTKPAYSAVYVQGQLVASADRATRWITDLTLQEGLNTISIMSKNQQGVFSTVQTVSVTRDTTGPVGTILLNGGTVTTQTSVVTLNLTATDALSGVDAMSFAIDGGAWTSWEPCVATKQMTLPDLVAIPLLYRLRDKLGNETTYQVIIKSVGMSAATALSKSLANLLANALVPQSRGEDTFVTRQRFLWRLSQLTPTECSMLYTHLSVHEQAMLKMLVATMQQVPIQITDDELHTLAEAPVQIQGFTNPNFVNNINELETLDPTSAMAFMGLLSTPIFATIDSWTTWASDSLIMVVMNARWNECARLSIVGKLLLLEGNMPIPLTARYYFTWSGAPDINITFAPITYTTADLSDLRRLQASTIEAYRTWATKAIGGIH